MNISTLAQYPSSEPIVYQMIIFLSFFLNLQLIFWNENKFDAIFHWFIRFEVY